MCNQVPLVLKTSTGFLGKKRGRTLANNQPYGFYKLPGWRLAVRNLACRTTDNRLGRMANSLLRKIALFYWDSPVDIAIYDSQKARLHPKDNICEKRMFGGSQYWDITERNFLDTVIAKSDKDTPFIFIDAGANVGLYSIFMDDRAQHYDKKIKILAIEPDPTNRARLEFNILSSNIDTITVIPDAIGDGTGTGTGQLLQPDDNRGQVRLNQEAKPNTDSSLPVVTIRPLVKMLKEHDIDSINALKIDIEGYEEVALKAFFAEAPTALWPKLLIMETWGEGTPALELCLKKGYGITQETRLNAILEYQG